MPSQPVAESPMVTQAEAKMIDLARKHVARHGYPAGDQSMTRLIHALQAAIPAPRPVDIEQPGKSAAARATRLAALQRETTPAMVATGECHLPACAGSPTGWRLYVHEGWQPVCTRHMGAAKSLARVFNRDLA